MADRQPLTRGNSADYLDGSRVLEARNSGNGDNVTSDGGDGDTINGGETEGIDQRRDVEYLKFAGPTNSSNGAIARSDAATATESQTISIAILATDEALNGSALRMRKLGGGIAAVGDQVAVTAEGAVITLGENDILIFTPGTAYDFLDAGEPFAATFTYAVTNSTGLVSAAKVTVTITGVNDGPLLLNGIATTLRTTRPSSTFSQM